MSYIRFEKHNGTGVLYLARSEKLNAIDERFMDELQRFLDTVEGSNIRALIVTNADSDVFASGGDIGYFLTLNTANDARMMAYRMHVLLNRFEELEIPTVCAINGSAIGGGAELAVAFDIRFMRNDSFIQFKEKQIGVTTGWGGTYRLVRLVGYSTALKLLLSAEKVDAKTAIRIGLVDEIYDRDVLLKKALEFCETFSDDDLRLVRYIKRLARQSMFLERDSYMELERRLFSESWMFGKREEMMKRFVKKER